jgi:mannosyltransferase OCH1-like enzyme
MSITISQVRCRNRDNVPDMRHSTAIPRILHQIWLGGRPMPLEFRRFAAGWRRNHSRWEYCLWSEDSLPELHTAATYEAVQPLAGKADVLRYELVWRFGGVYVDTDVECLRPLDPLLRGLPAFIADQRRNRPINCVLGAVAGHGLTEALVAGVGASFAAQRGLFEQTGPGFLKRTLYRYLGPGFTVTPGQRGFLHRSADGQRAVHGFESGVFCPYDSHEKHRRHEPFPAAYAVHHWAGSWLAG